MRKIGNKYHIYSSSKLKFWRDLICKYCLEEKQSSSVSIAELKEVFKRNGTRPYCLETVFEEMTNASEVQTKAEFLLPAASTLTGWALDSLVKRPLRWGFNKVKDSIWKVKDDNTEFIVLSVLKVLCQIIFFHWLFTLKHQFYHFRGNLKKF
jgi:charged multivesicular body protein 7